MAAFDSVRICALYALELATARPLGSLLVGLIGYLTTLAIYRLVLHPLNQIPGPRVAALTSWYEFYWDCPKKGTYFRRIQEMHKHYGEYWSCARS